MTEYKVEEVRREIAAQGGDSVYAHLMLGNAVDSSLGQIVPLHRGADTERTQSYNYHPTVLVFQIGSQFFKKDGYHDSWEGAVWDGGLEEVYPETKTIVTVGGVEIQANTDALSDAYLDLDTSSWDNDEPSWGW